MPAKTGEKRLTDPPVWALTRGKYMYQYQAHKFEIGDVIVNPWVSEYTSEGKHNPCYAMIYLGGDKKIKCLRSDKQICEYYCTKDSEHFWYKIGHVDIFSNLKEVIEINDERHALLQVQK